ncbi:MAG: TRAP transporter small permease subunit [Chloroflexaceae bacterium]|nr:TRAP transporter small permease subunit [Chloroflexaceae bacterium]
MQALLQLSRGIDALVRGIGKLLPYLVTIMIAAGFYNVVARYLGRFVGQRLTSNAIIEIQWYLFSVLFFLGFALILKENMNVRVDFLYSKWSAKRRALVDLLGHLFFLIPFCILGIVVTINPVLFSWGRLPNGSWGPWEMSSDADGLPRAPIKTMIIVAFVFLLLQAISQVIKELAVLTNQVPQQEAAALEEYHQQPVE